MQSRRENFIFGMHFNILNTSLFVMQPSLTANALPHPASYLITQASEFLITQDSNNLIAQA